MASIAPLYPSVDTEEIIDRIGVAVDNRENLNANSNTSLKAVIILITFSNIFLFDDKFFRLSRGARVIRNIGPIGVQMLIREFDFGDLDKKLSLWLRYVDDISIIWEHGRQTLSDFFSTINGIDNTLEFTLEMEKIRLCRF